MPAKKDKEPEEIKAENNEKGDSQSFPKVRGTGFRTRS